MTFIRDELDEAMVLITPFKFIHINRLFITIFPSIHADWGDHLDLAHGRDVGRSHRNGGVLAVVSSGQPLCDGRQKHAGVVLWSERSF